MSDDVQSEVQALYDDRAETALLGAWLSDDKKSSDYLQHKKPVDDFYRTEHSDIVRAIEAIVSSGKQADPVTVAARLKVTAVRLGVYILALSQVSHEAVKQGSVLKMQDLKGSSGLEQAADDVILLSELEESSEERGVLGCVVDKHRSGKRGSC